MAIFIVEARVRVSLEADTAEGALAAAKETFGEIPIDEFEFSVEAQDETDTLKRCPVCGETRVELLHENQPGIIDCASCGTVYDPIEEAKEAKNGIS